MRPDRSFTGKLLLALLWLIGPRIAAGQKQFGSFQEVLRYADQHALPLQTSRLQEQISRSAEKQSKAFLLPNISGAGAFTDNITLQPTLVPARLTNPAAPENSYLELTFGKQFIYTYGIQVQWDILNFQKWFAAQTARVQTGLAAVQTSLTRYTMYNQLAGTYYALLLSREIETIYVRNLATTSEISGYTAEKYAKGLVSEELRNRSSIQQLQAERNLADIKTQYRQLSYDLQNQLNTNDSIALAETWPQTVETSTPASFANTHPAVLVQQSLLQQAHSQLSQSKSLLYPSLSAGYQYNYNWATDRFQHFANANPLPQQYLSLRLNVPIFSGFANRQRINQGELSIKVQELQLVQVSNQVAQEDKTLQLQYDQSRDQLQKARQILTLQEQNDRHVQNRYEQGVISLDERLDRLNDLFKCQNDYVQCLSNYSVSRYKILIRQLDFQHE
ncbi:TolC family protein [Siphonobacter aquaeclarae]|uniref:Outer membrane protein TolC n=1 Tax=Siphonobacter aquaeclarae TaxID=563176 RepID=A0A1G9YPP8_9BACT|nr:TolC family protein [Siphonobacter aquaeclarae]SDN11054.1 Outer membrane protein TolC [Siphonobacter aquaeclarae]